MLSGLLAQRTKRQLVTAIKNGDLKRLNALLDKTDSSLITERLIDGDSALSLAITQDQPLVLQELLKRGEFANCSDAEGQPLIWGILSNHPSPLKLTTVLLQQGASPDTTHNERSLLELASQYEDPIALPLLSRLVEFGASLASTGPLVTSALEQGSQARVKFLIESGAPWNRSLATAATNPEVVDYAERIWQDKQLRDQWF